MLLGRFGSKRKTSHFYFFALFCPRLQLTLSYAVSIALLIIITFSNTVLLSITHPYNTFFSWYSLQLCFLPFSAPPLKCYSCVGSGQKCRHEVLSINTSAQEVCKGEEDRCFWGYQRLNGSFEAFGMGCNSAQNCNNLPRFCQVVVSSNQMECCEVSCCASDLCNKLKYTGK